MKRVLFLFLFLTPCVLSLVALNPQLRAPIRSLSASSTNSSLNQNHSISGYGAPRQNLKECLTAIPDFEKSLSDAGIEVSQISHCIPSNDIDGAYVPVFHGSSVQPLSVTMEYYAAYNTLIACELQRLSLTREIKSKGRLIESSCHQSKSGLYVPYAVKFAS